MSSTREKILHTAADIMYKKGINKLTIKEISKTLGIQTSSIHYYFEYKDDIIETLSLSFIEKFHNYIADVKVMDELSDYEQIVVFYYAFYKIMFYDYRFLKLVYELLTVKTNNIYEKIKEIDNNYDNLFNTKENDFINNLLNFTLLKRLFIALVDLYYSEKLSFEDVVKHSVEYHYKLIDQKFIFDHDEYIRLAKHADEYLDFSDLNLLNTFVC